MTDTKGSPTMIHNPIADILLRAVDDIEDQEAESFAEYEIHRGEITKALTVMGAALCLIDHQNHESDKPELEAIRREFSALDTAHLEAALERLYALELDDVCRPTHALSNLGDGNSPPGTPLPWQE